MPAGSWFLFAGLPTLGVVGYFLAASLLPQTHLHLLFWENGAVELATAALFALAGVLGILLGRRCGNDTPRPYRLLYLALGVGALIAALEEVSYGQHLFGWQANGWFARHNIQQETNLHNLFGDTTRRVLHQIGGNGCLIAGLILPALAMLTYRDYRPGHWTHFLLPRRELMPVVVLEVLVRILKHSPAGEPWRFVLDEFRECLWSAALLLYVVVMWRRLGPGREQAVIRVCDDESHPHRNARQPLRRAA